MAANSIESHGEKLTLQEISTGLTNELRLRTDHSGAGQSNSPPMASQLKSSLESCLKEVCQGLKIKASPRNHSCAPVRGVGCPRSPGASSDSSLSGGVSKTPANTPHSRSPGRKFIGVNIIPNGSTKASSSRRVPLNGVAIAGLPKGAGRGSGNVNAGAAKAPIGAVTGGRGKALQNPQHIGGIVPLPKEKKKRKRPSKKPPTINFEASPEEFLGMVQRLTGMKEPAPEDNPQAKVEVVRPQPVRNLPVVKAIPIDLKTVPPHLPVLTQPKLEVETESSSLGKSCEAGCAPRSTADQNQPEIDTYRHSSSSGTSSSSRSLNYTMGYETDPFPILAFYQQEHHNPPGYDPEHEYDVNTRGDNGQTSAVKTGRLTLQVDEGKKKEVMSNIMDRPSGGSSGLGSGQTLPENSRLYPVEGFDRSGRPYGDFPYGEEEMDWENQFWTLFDNQ